MLQLVVPVTRKKKKTSKQDDRFWTFSNQGAQHPRDKGTQLDTKGCRCVNLDESASEVEDKRSGSLEGSAKAQLRRVINGSVSENSRRAGCDTAANCRRFKSSFDSSVIFSGFSGRMERSTNRCRSHVGAFLSFFFLPLITLGDKAENQFRRSHGSCRNGIGLGASYFYQEKTRGLDSSNNSWHSHPRMYEYV